MNAATIQDTVLARKFGALLLRDIGADKLAEVVKRNAAEQSAGVCHSHDFCDANMTMAEAFEHVLGRPVDLQSDRDTAQWERSWNAAKANNFFTP